MQRTAHRTEVARSWGTSNDRLEDQVRANQELIRDVALGKPEDPPGEAPWTEDYPFTNLPLRPVLRHIRSYVDTEILDPVRAILTG